jgi:GNAT superfamily N-acetyltransferase
MLDRGDLRPRRSERTDLAVRRADIPSPELSRFLYTAVGGPHYWTDRLGWTHADWLRYLDPATIETWVAYVSNTPAGYFELERQPRDNVQLAQFGLLQQFIGQGIGGDLLTVAIERAFDLGARRVWVHTNSLDSPHALPNYQARGFKIFETRTETVAVAERPPGPWPGAE